MTSSRSSRASVLAASLLVAAGLAVAVPGTSQAALAAGALGCTMSGPSPLLRGQTGTFTVTMANKTRITTGSSWYIGILNNSYYAGSLFGSLAPGQTKTVQISVTNQVPANYSPVTYVSSFNIGESTSSRPVSACSTTTRLYPKNVS